MKYLFSCCRYEDNDNGNSIDDIEIIPNLTNDEKQNIANKRIQYLETKYPPQKPLDTSKKVYIQSKDNDKHDQYIRDWRD